MRTNLGLLGLLCAAGYLLVEAPLPLETKLMSLVGGVLYVIVTTTLSVLKEQLA